MVPTIFVGVFILFMLMGIPVAYTLGATALVTGLVIWGPGGIPIDALAQRLAYGPNNFTTLAIPLFLFAGKLMNEGTITDRLFNFCQSLVGRFPGGLGHVNVLGSVIFAGMSGSAAADAAGLGAIEIKAMTANGYDTEFSAAITASSALLSPIIPPSVAMVVYGVLSNTSVARLFIGGVVPGLLMSAGLCALVWYFSVKRNYPRCAPPTLKEFIVNVKKAFLPLMTPVIIIGGIWTGVFTPTEAAAVTVGYVLFLIMLVYRSMRWKDIWILIKSSTVDCAAIMLIISCVSVYGYVLTLTNIPLHVAQAILNVTTNPFLILLLLNLFLLVAGCFMSTLECIMLFTPIFLPLLQQAHTRPRCLWRHHVRKFDDRPAHTSLRHDAVYYKQGGKAPHEPACGSLSPVYGIHRTRHGFVHGLPRPCHLAAGSCDGLTSVRKLKSIFSGVFPG